MLTATEVEDALVNWLTTQLGMDHSMLEESSSRAMALFRCDWCLKLKTWRLHHALNSVLARDMVRNALTIPVSTSRRMFLILSKSNRTWALTLWLFSRFCHHLPNHQTARMLRL